MNISELIDLDRELVVDKISSDFESIVKMTGECGFMETMFSVINIMSNIEFMKSGIFSLINADDIYSSEILYRCMIEHYLKQKYLYLKYLSTKNNSVGIEFKYFGDISEQYDFINSINKQNGIFQKNEKEIDFNQIIGNKYPQYLNLTKKEIREIKNQFSVNNIIKSINEMEKIKSGVSEMKDFILDYSILSSFVHGGQNSINAMLSYSINPMNKESEKYKIVRQAINISYLSRINVLLLSSFFYKDYKKVIQKIVEQTSRITP